MNDHHGKALFATALPPLDDAAQDANRSPRMPFWHIKDAGDGHSTIEQAWLGDFMQQVVSAPTTPIWMHGFAGQVRAVWFNVLSVGWIGHWHPSPRFNGSFRFLIP